MDQTKVEKTQSELIEELRKDMKEVVWENRIQTIFVLFAFFFGVMTIRDLAKK